MKKVFQISKVAILSFFTIAIASCSSGDEVTPIVNTPTGPTKNIVQLAQANPNLSRLVEAVTQAGLGATLSGAGTFTVFAPTNAAFDASNITSAYIAAQVSVAQKEALKQILLNHVLGATYTSTQLTTNYYKTLAIGTASATNKLSMYVSNTPAAGVLINGGSATGFNGGKVSTADAVATNGIVHIVDGVIKLPTVVDHAKANNDFSTLVAALTFNSASGFATTLSGTGPFTVFAPTNAAFTAFLTEIGVTTGLPGIPPATLEKVLKYHVVNGVNVLSTTLVNNQIVQTFAGTTPNEAFTIQIATTGGGTTVTIKDASNRISTITYTDVQAANGVIHVINKVLKPV